MEQTRTRSSLPPDTCSSFLRPGAVFVGTQSYVPPKTVREHHDCPHRPIFHHHYPHSSRHASSPAFRRILALAQVPPSSREEWQVRVIIHQVDMRSGQIKGSMQAINVPNSSKNVITSFDGEIVDFSNHSLWTRNTNNFDAADRAVDLEYWSMVPAFHGVTQDQIVNTDFDSWHKLVLDDDATTPATSTCSSDTPCEKENFATSPTCSSTCSSSSGGASDWILMRWKERDFVNCQPHESGLTIQGYYYCCLSRKNGVIDAYYHDVTSAPYQKLSLSPYCPSPNGGASFMSFDVL